MKVSSISFCGICRPYVNSNGVKVIPISSKPNDREIESAIGTSKNYNKKPMEGYNGYVYWLGEDLVLKKFKGDEAFSNDPSREINMLDSMYDNSLVFNNSQTGKYAFTTPDGETYLVSTKVEGKNPSLDNPFTKENLKSLVGIISQMDSGADFKGSSKKGFSDRCRFMNYDFNGGNINITPLKAGLFDFEYAVIENLDDMIDKTIIRHDTGANCHQSDTSGVPSSLRSFEFYTFCPYLLSLDNPKSIFQDYLEIKGDYHKKMSEFYADYANQSDFRGICKGISKKELVHSGLLKKDEKGCIPEDILKAEAYKIQMSHFMHEQSQFSDTGRINPKQLKDYTKKITAFFKASLEHAEASGDKDRVIYYNDCLELMASWMRVNTTLAEKIEKKDPEIMKKLITTEVTTLDELI